MQSKKLMILAAVTATSVVMPLSGVLNSSAATTTPSLDILKGAYAFVDSYPPDKHQWVTVVFRTAKALPRRSDGMIRGGGGLDKMNASLGSARGSHGTARHCYRFLSQIFNGRLRGGQKTKVSRGSKHTVVVSARGTSGDLSDSTTVTIRKKRAGDRGGKPLGC